MVPTIHLNGTSKDALVDGLIEASAAVDIAMLRLREAAPNGRDYYPQGPTAIREAIREHDARLEKLRAVRDEILAILETLQNGGAS